LKGEPPKFKNPLEKSKTGTSHSHLKIQFTGEKKVWALNQFHRIFWFLNHLVRGDRETKGNHLKFPRSEEEQKTVRGLV